MAAIIGITTNCMHPEGEPPRTLVSDLYIQAILRAGGVPLLIPNGLSQAQVEALRSRIDGILLTGGGDIDLSYFNGKPHPRVYGIEKRRDETEIALVNCAASTGWPFLGICRGIQVINVALGRTLYTHIQDQLPGALKHDYFPNYPRDYLAHRVSLAKGSSLQKIIGAAGIETNSLHHQGLDQIGRDLRVSANAPDGLVEAVELESHPFGLGVQWHPECMPDSPRMQAIFKCFVEAAGRSS
jgi:putative glutamine amidotransferase